jgi:hypothetical protein
MASLSRTKRTCRQGHVYFKSSSCPTCPECERNHVPASDFLRLVSAPARRALEREGILTTELLSNHTERQILSLHGIGKTTIPVLKNVLEQEGRTFQHETNQSNK